MQVQFRIHPYVHIYEYETEEMNAIQKLSR
jgi:hypothetical protein